MARQRANKAKQTKAKAIESTGGEYAPSKREIPVRVLVVSGSKRVLNHILRALDGRCERVDWAINAVDAHGLVEREPVDVVLVDAGLDGGRGVELIAQLTETHDGLLGVLLTDSADVSLAVEAMRAGVVDLIDPKLAASKLRARIAAVGERSEKMRRTARQVVRLKKLCQHLNSARQEVSGQVGSLCNDLVDAYRDLSEQIDDVSMAGELNALLRQELEVESLLRTMLEYLLAKVGATNAAIFLPSTTGEFSLGAYVNYDCPKESAEVLLDQMADTVAPRFENQLELIVLDNDIDLRRALGDDAEWMIDSAMMVVACHHEGECLGVMVLFRDRSKPFAAESQRTVTIASRLFAAQLGRVIRIHHRHLPEGEWGWFDGPEADDEFDDFGEGFDDYGLAA